MVCLFTDGLIEVTIAPALAIRRPERTEGAAMGALRSKLLRRRYQPQPVLLPQLEHV
jgi:hypothetical protein